MFAIFRYDRYFNRLRKYHDRTWNYLVEISNFFWFFWNQHILIFYQFYNSIICNRKTRFLRTFWVFCENIKMFNFRQIIFNDYWKYFDCFFFKFFRDYLQFWSKIDFELVLLKSFVSNSWFYVQSIKRVLIATFDFDYDK